MAFGASNISLAASGGLDGDLSGFTFQYAASNVVSGKDIWFSPDGTKFWATQYSSPTAYLRQYVLSTPWDLTTASLQYTRNLTADGVGQSQVWGIAFSYDGLHMYHQQGRNYVGVDYYSVGTPFDASTATKIGRTGSLWASSNPLILGGISTTPAGDYITHIIQKPTQPCGYNYILASSFMSVPNDITSIPTGGSQSYFQCTDKSNAYVNGVCYNGDGTKAYWSGELNSPGIRQVSLTIPYRMQSITIDPPSIGGNFQGIFMSPDNSMLFASGSGGIRVYTAS